MTALPALEKLSAAAYTVPTDGPESDGTIAWDATTVVVVTASAGGETGLGYAYGSGAAAAVADGVLFPAVRGDGHRSAADVPAAYAAMVREVRNIGRAGVASTAISATDTALWDLKARLLGLPLADLLGRVRPAVAAYGSGGFCSYTPEQLTEQLGGWAAQGYRMVKMKVGRNPADDIDRVATARKAIGPDVALFVDANGAYDRREALAFAEAFSAFDVAWFEEPVSSDDLDGLRLVRDRAPAGMAVAAGEYGHDPWYFRRMLAAGAVDVLQADATRCGGVSGFLAADALCQAFGVPLSAHTSPTLHAHLCCAVPTAVHVEAFHDHLRLEALLFDGALVPEDGMLRPAADRPGLGLALRAAAAEYAAAV
ncbi:MAG TPA: enolase C-terminal domain-like protein [Acidimicrobiia bacterium]|nr:enolase C-terminal domain-like protein [Acidimicrobiia bacterium]